MNILRWSYVPVAIAAFIALSFGVHAQTFPAKTIRIIVPFPPGGTSDASARIIAQKLTERFERTVVVDNRGGAGGNIATEFVARSAPDGYTMIMGTHGTHAINVSIFPKLGFDPVRDFAPITLVLTVPNLILIHPSLPVASVKDLIALAKAKPGQLNFASAGYGTMPHMTGELLNYMAGIRMVPVLYKGSGPALIDLLGGFVPIMIESVLTSLPHVKAGKVKAIAITSAARSATLPDIPTVSESGQPGYVGLTWVGLLVPAGTPQEIVGILNREIVKILEAPDVRTRLHEFGATPSGGPPEQFASYIREETAKWAKVVKAANIKAE